MPLPNLNNQLLLHIFAYLPLTSYASLILTCRRFHSLVVNNQSLFKTWCINKLTNYIASTTPLPDDLDYKWLFKCLHHDITKVQDPNTHTYGYIHNHHKLHIRSITQVSTSEYGIHVISQGKGVFINQFETYTGEFENDHYEGLGAVTWANGESYHGYFHNGCKNGHGTHKYKDGSSYVGGWYWNNRTGHGTHRLVCGSSYVGQFNTDMYYGLGTFTLCIEGKVANTHTGVWLYHVPIGCEFGHVFYKCRNCKLNLCRMCTVSNHGKCFTRKKWSVAAKMVLDCKHEKQELSKIE